jgi:hypothetical protein
MVPQRENAMTTKVRIWIAGITLLAMFALIYLSGPSYAHGQDDLAQTVKKIAVAINKGDNDGAKKLAAATAKNAKLIDEISDLMHMYRPKDKGGLGIEKALKNPAPTDAQELGNLVNAMAELTLAKGWPMDEGKKTKKAWNDFAAELRAAGQQLAKANDAKGVTAAATKITNVCNRCHSLFKE